MAFGIGMIALLAAKAAAAAKVAAPALAAAKAAGAGTLAAGATKAGASALTSAPSAAPAPVASAPSAVPQAAPVGGFAAKVGAVKSAAPGVLGPQVVGQGISRAMAPPAPSPPTGTGAFTFGRPTPSAASGLTVPEATTSFMAGFQPGGLTTNASTLAEGVRNTAPTFLDKLAAFGSEFGQDALRGGIAGGIRGGIRGNQNRQIGTTRGIGLGALAGGVSGGVSGGFGSLANENLGMGQALQGLSQSGTPAQSFGQQLAGGVKDLFLGEQPVQSILGSEPPGTRRGVIPNLIRRVDLNIPIGSNRRAKVRPFGRRGLTGRGLRVARGRR